ncbi:HET domain-containing protein [Fusarium sp. LHS14.1]|nr:HET domain-containing protein [Fusarium sp. LHS14.1]
MRTIYRNAHEVLVWLGEADSHSRRVFEYLSLSKWNAFRQNTNWNSIGFDLTITEHKDFPMAADLGSLEELLEKPWFRRLWILQEVALAKRATLMAGNGRISWESFASLIHQVHRSGASQKDFSASAQAGMKAIFEIESTRRSMQSSFAKPQGPLLSVLLATSSGECSNIRDKIFAVLALAGDYDLDRDADGFGPNYHLSPQEIFKKFAKWCISRGNLNVLSCTTRTGPDLSGELGELPSWVPDWTRIHNDAPFIRHGDRLPFNAGLLVKGSIIDTPKAMEDDTLILSGVTVDVVKEVAPPIESGAPRNLGSMLLHYKRWLCDRHDMNYLDGNNELPNQNLGEFFWRTMTAGLNGEGCLATDNVGRWFHDYLRQVEQTEPQSQGFGLYSPTGSVLGDDPRHTWRHNSAVMAAVLKWSYKRRPAVTDRGTMALVPENTQNGDVIVVVAGAKVPLVFRRLQAGVRESYAVIGEAFAVT